MATLSVPVNDQGRKALAKKVNQALTQNTLEEFAEATTLSISSIKGLSAGRLTTNPNIALYVLVGIADVMYQDPYAFIEEFSPGAKLDPVMLNTVRTTISRRKARLAAKSIGIPVRNSIKATVGEPEPVGDISAPSAIELMKRIRNLSETDRWMVGEFLEAISDES